MVIRQLTTRAPNAAIQTSLRWMAHDDELQKPHQIALLLKMLQSARRLERVSAKCVPAKCVPAKSMTAKSMTAKSMTAMGYGLHESSLLVDVSPAPVKPDKNPEVVKKDAMQPLRVKSRKNGSRKRTCPKADMPKSR